MKTGEIYEAEIEHHGRRGRQAGRVLATLVGAAALLVGAFLTWVPGRTGDKLTDRALVQPNFGAQGDLVKAVGGLSILIALVALLGLVDRTGWLTRLAGGAGLVVFVMFGVQAYRFYGHDLGTEADRFGSGTWLVLAGAAVLLFGGFLGARMVRVPVTPRPERPARSTKPRTRTRTRTRAGGAV